MSPAIGEFAIQELARVQAVNARLIFALQIARASLDDALQAATSDQRAYCPRCEQVVTTIDDGETCAQCKLVL
jgi:hypothetical protein